MATARAVRPTSNDALLSYRSADVFTDPLAQGSPNFFVRGPHKLIKNMSRAGRFTQCDCLGICYILPNQQLFRKHISQFFFNIIFFIIKKMASRAGWNGLAGRSLETPALAQSVRELWPLITLRAMIVSFAGLKPTNFKASAQMIGKLRDAYLKGFL